MPVGLTGFSDVPQNIRSAAYKGADRWVVGKPMVLNTLGLA